MKRLFLNTIQEVENLKTLLGNPRELEFRYLRMKGMYLVAFPESLEPLVRELGY